MIFCCLPAFCHREFVFTLTAPYITHPLKVHCQSVIYANKTCELFIHRFVQTFKAIFAVFRTFCPIGIFCFFYSVHYRFVESTMSLFFPYQVMQMKHVDCSSLLLYSKFKANLFIFEILKSLLGFQKIQYFSQNFQQFIGLSMIH